MTEKYARSLAPVYPGRTDAEIHALLNEVWSRPFEFESFSQLKERAFAGRYVNVDRAGFRHVAHQGAWPPDRLFFNVFVFGGSSTFGYGVADDESVVSYLQAELGELRLPRPPRLYNFGRGHYFSSQERVLFEKLLVAGVVPDAAIFIDGLNEFYFRSEPAFTQELARCVDQTWRDWMGDRYDAWLEQPGFAAAAPTPSPSVPAPRTDVEARSLADLLIERYLRNVRATRAVAGAFGVRTVFIWQPVPLYRYDLKHHRFADRGFAGHEITGLAYGMMRERIREAPPGRDFVWAADVQQDVAEPLYVDAVHYTPEAARRLASHVRLAIAAGDLLAPPPG